VSHCERVKQYGSILTLFAAGLSERRGDLLKMARFSNSWLLIMPEFFTIGAMSAFCIVFWQ
jgi:hypothetical protein